MAEFMFDRTFSKSPCIYKKVGNTYYPIVYLRRAKNVTNEDYEKVIELLFRKSKRK